MLLRVLVVGIVYFFCSFSFVVVVVVKLLLLSPSLFFNLYIFLHQILLTIEWSNELLHCGLKVDSVGVLMLKNELSYNLKSSSLRFSYQEKVIPVLSCMITRIQMHAFTTIEIIADLLRLRHLLVLLSSRDR